MNGIAEVVSQIEYKVAIGNTRSEELIEKVGQMKNMADSSLNVTSKKIIETRASIDQTLLKLQSLSRIEDMVNQIIEITNQTNLLSLNASIEAARAGESSNGFVESVNDIQKQIEEAKVDPNNASVSTEGILEKLNQISASTERLMEVTYVNQKNSIAIRTIVDYFSEYKAI